MPRRKKKTDGPEHTLLSVKVSDFAIRVESDIDPDVRVEKRRHDDMRVYAFGTHIIINGACRYPEERQGAQFELTIYSGTRDEEEMSRVLKDYRAYDEHYQPLSKKVRGRYVPIYRVPSGIALIDKRRGVNAWTSTAWVDRHTASDMISMLGRFDPLYVGIHEIRLGRLRWALSVALQTTDPANE